MLLVGGLEAWKRDIGDTEVDQGGSSNGSPVPALNGGISSSSSSSSVRYTSPPYVRNRSGTESSLSSSYTNRELGALNENSRLPPPAEPPLGPSYTLPQPSEGINGFGGDSKSFNHPVTVNGRSPSSNRTDFVRTSLRRSTSLYSLIHEPLLGHAKLCKWNHFHPIPLIPKTRRHFLSVPPSPSYPCDSRARVTPNRVH